jgi:hypothetical protein
MIGPGRCSTDLDAKANGLALDCGSHRLTIRTVGMPAKVFHWLWLVDFGSEPFS